jgi:arylesterase/paraoxonase
MKKFLLFLLLVLVFVGSFLAYIFYTTSFFRKIESSNDFGPIYQTIALPGVEDMATARTDSLLILSVDDREARREGKEGFKGLYLIDLRDPSFEEGLAFSEGIA